MKRGQIAGLTLGIGVLASVGYIYFEDYSPAGKAQRAQKDRAVGQTLAQLVCADNIEGRDDGETPAETVAKAIIANCGPLMPVAGRPTGGCSDRKCMQSMQQTDLLMETMIVVEARDDRTAWARGRVDDAKAALVWAKTH